MLNFVSICLNGWSYRKKDFCLHATLDTVWSGHVFANPDAVLISLKGVADIT